MVSIVFVMFFSVSLLFGFEEQAVKLKATIKIDKKQL